MKPEPPQDAREAKARAAGLAFVPLDGDIGVIGNGAGLVMSTIDQIAAAGGRAADFCDIGGGARSEVAQAALEAMFAGPPVAAVLVNIFGGITRCEDVAKGLVEAIGAAGVDVPVVVRLDGNAAEEGHAVLRGRGPPQRDLGPRPRRGRPARRRHLAGARGRSRDGRGGRRRGAGGEG